MLDLSFLGAIPYIIVVSNMLILTSMVVLFFKIIGTSPFSWSTCVTICGLFGLLGAFGLFAVYQAIQSV